MFTIARDLVVSLETCLVSVLGPEYNKLKYLDDLSKNSFNRNTEAYGIRPGATPQNVPTEVCKSIDYLQTFELVLTKKYCQDGVSDSGKYEAFLDLHELALTFNNEVIVTKAGLPTRVLNVINLSIQEPLFLEDKVAVLTASFDIIYRLRY